MKFATNKTTMPVEQRLIEAIRILAPEKQQLMLEFAEFLQSKQSADKPSSEAAPTASSVILADRGIGVEQAADLRSRLQTFSEDWNRPEMALYDEL